MTVYIVENYYDEPIFQAYKTSDGAKLGLLEQYTKNFLPKIIECIQKGESVKETSDNIKTDLEKILAHGYIEDFGIIHECELKE